MGPLKATPKVLFEAWENGKNGPFKSKSEGAYCSYKSFGKTDPY